MKKIDLDSLTKLESSSINKEIATNGKELVEVIVKVGVENYVPDEVDVRAQIDSTMFTAKIQSSLLRILEQDSNVVSIALGTRLRVDESEDIDSTDSEDNVGKEDCD